MPAQTIIKVRRDTAANWAGTDPVLAAGEHGYETDTGKFKIGDGTTHYLLLDYATDWANITEKPTSFTPSAHKTSHEFGGTDAITIAQSQVTDLTTNLAAKVTNPMTAAGDLIVGGTSGAPARLAKGIDGQVLSLASGTPAWTAPPSGGVTSVSATAPITSTGGTTPTIALSPIANANVAINAAIQSDKISVSTGNSTNGATGVGFRGIPSSSVSGGSTTQYFIDEDDAGRIIWSTAGRTLVINKTTHPIGTTLVFATGSGATISISTNIGNTFIQAGLGVKTSFNLSPFGMATAVKVDATTWLFSGVGLVG